MIYPKIKQKKEKLLYSGTEFICAKIMDVLYYLTKIIVKISSNSIGR